MVVVLIVALVILYMIELKYIDAQNVKIYLSLKMDSSNMKKYKFVKIKNILTDTVYDDWYLLCDNITQIEEHFNLYIRGIISDAFKEFSEKLYEGNLADLKLKSEWGVLCRKISELNNVPFQIASLQCENDLLNTRLSLFHKRGSILLSNKIKHLDPNTFKVVDELIKNNITWPTYSINDIKIVQWPNGEHYYAKIGNMDIVDDKGNQKWNTYDEAFLNAKKFLENE